MNNLFFGGSSNLALKLSNKIKFTDAVSQKKITGKYRKTFRVNDYSNISLRKIKKDIDQKYDNILIFNGYYSASFLSIFNSKKFLDTYKINFIKPIEIAVFVLKNNLLKRGGSIFFFSSAAANEDLIGNAFYSIAKNSLNLSSKILSNEQKERGVRINTISLGLIKNDMGIKAKNLTNSNKNFLSTNLVIKRITSILRNKKLNKKNIKIV
jgi:NAD(P)-dependent dehydrogenase (short-subunit alcohol dehydrogenase family)